MKVVKAIVASIGLGIATLTLQGCHEDEENENESDGAGQLVKTETMPVLGQVLYQECKKKITGDECLHVRYEMNFKDFFHQLTLDTADGIRARKEFRDNYISATKKFGDEVSIEFMPVDQATYAIAPLAYRLFHAPGISKTPPSETAFTNEYFAQAKVHANQNSQDKVSAFKSSNAQGASLIIAPVEALNLPADRKQSYRFFGSFMADDSLADVRDSFLKRLGTEFEQQMGNTPDASRNAVFISTEGVTHHKHHNKDHLGQKWAAVRFDFSTHIHGLGMLLYNSKDWQTHTKPAAMPAYVKALKHHELETQNRHDQRAEAAGAARALENHQSSHPAHAGSTI